MFDRLPPSISPVGLQSAADESVVRLCRLYDGQLDKAGGSLTAKDVQDLKAMAGIYDLDTNRAPGEIWRDLRAVITRQAPSVTEEETQELMMDAEPLTVMVVEDDADSAAALTELLVDAGHRVIGPFHNAASAEAAVALHAVDVALLDINLSDERTGVELAQILNERWKIRVVFISGDVATAARHAKLADALVLKPYTGGQVLEAVSRPIAA